MDNVQDSGKAYCERQLSVSFKDKGCIVVMAENFRFFFFLKASHSWLSRWLSASIKRHTYVVLRRSVAVDPVTFSVSFDRETHINISGLWIYFLYAQFESQQGQGLPWPRFLVVYFSAFWRELWKHLSKRQWSFSEDDTPSLSKATRPHPRSILLHMHFYTSQN
jgi:hypothetical protein